MLDGAKCSRNVWERVVGTFPGTCVVGTNVPYYVSYLEERIKRLERQMQTAPEKVLEISREQKSLQEDLE